MFRKLTLRHALIVRVTSVLFACAAWSQAASADFIQQGPKLVGMGATGSSSQGFAVAVSADGNTAIVGGVGGSAGAAWVFVRSNGAWNQQGDKLVGAGNVGGSAQGWSVALAADGNTAIVGGPSDAGSSGAVWVFVRSNGVWTPQGGKLIGTGATGTSEQGYAVALSADGNTALVGGRLDDSFKGAAWVFTRNAGSWTQQGQKLLASDATGPAQQGYAVALSADGNTALIGGREDSSANGAAWVFVRNSGTWSQVGNRLVGSGATGAARQGSSVALSADGRTAAVGGFSDAISRGAAWIYTFNGTAWVQQGSKLVGTGVMGSPQQGKAISLSGDGNTLFSSGYNDVDSIGSVWVFGRSNGVWSQQGNKLAASDNSGMSRQGFSLALSTDGSTAVVGGYGDNSQLGAAWIWLRRTPHDFNGGGKSDILWRTTGGDLALWLMNGTAASSVAGLGNIGANWTPAGQRDFNGDGKTDILWRETSGAIAMWLMNGTSAISVASLGNIGANWTVAGTADFNGDGNGDILWRDTSGAIAMWLMNGTSASSVASLGNIGTNWSVVGTADFNGDGKGDILWRNTDGTNAIWLMNGTSALSTSVIGGVTTNWSVAGTADFNGDGKGDILWRNTDGSNAIWLMNGAAVASVALLGGVGPSWSVASNGDYDGDGKGDVLWREAGGSNAIWLMNGTTVASVSLIGGVTTNWSVQNAGAN